MDAVLEHIKAFIAAVKDDPSLSELFRVAANELHARLEPAQAAQVEQPAQVEPPPPPEG